ncbi:MAG: carboxypeptidase-like regulatory domain-containing protein [Bacteroidetes bacterium]|nr:carboxypeptidase-like regulatory domain-containing protein [Bacteroidota bacterium]MBU1116174.1 carboxypeptidase-like regulatory domain-containing protein [Bacteroidota bacterium]MBU1799848.1 carboxypeptidase-like regulatory domain-containing protein [Bacteroidota bacterium]
MKASFYTEIFIILFFFSFVTSFSQKNQLHTISGTITEKETGNPIPLVNVYLDGTTIGTTTNLNGQYTITNIPTDTYQIIASMIGFEQEKKSIQFTKKSTTQINFRLKTRSYKLDEISIITERDYVWNNNADLFQEQFLGTSINSEECKIVNREILDFVKTKDVQLIAKAKSPLVVVNKALGYRVFFDLKEFELSNSKEINYNGNTRFEELIPKNRNQKIEWEEKRKEAYNGSQRHFLTSLCKNQLIENGFYTYKLSEPNWGNLRRQDYLIPNLSGALQKVSESEWSLLFDDYIMIKYVDEWEEEGFKTYRNYLGSNIYKVLNFQTSWIKLLYGYVIFDNNGNLIEDFKNIKVFGYWGWQRVADLLPTNYLPQEIE